MEVANLILGWLSVCLGRAGRSLSSSAGGMAAVTVTPSPAGAGIMEEEREGKAGLGFQASCWKMCVQGGI